VTVIEIGKGHTHATFIEFTSGQLRFSGSCPAFDIGQGFIHELPHGCVGRIRLSRQAALAAAFLREAWAAAVRHPDLNRAKPRPAKAVAVLLNS